MPKLIQISGKKFCKILEKLGFEKIYGKGSHVRFKHFDGRKTVVPVHGNEDMGIGLLTAILKQIKLTREEFDADDYVTLGFYELGPRNNQGRAYFQNISDYNKKIYFTRL